MADLGVTPVYPDLKGKRVLVTGGSAGIGKATAFAFDASGAAVAVLGRRKERLDAVSSKLKHGVSIVADLTKSEDLPRAIQETVEKLGGLDILVNNGGPTTEAMFAGGDEATYTAAFQLHVTSTLALIRAAEEELIKNKGAVVNVSSAVAIIPMHRNFANYAVVKAAQDALTRNLAFEFASKDVRINSVLPGSIRTEAIELGAAMKGVSLEEMVSSLAKHHAIGRVAEPEEVAAPIVFLSSKAASFITGINMPVEGGALLGYWFNKEPMF